MSNILIYTTDDGATKIDLRLDEGTAWLSQLQIAELFQTTKQNVSKHIRAIYDDGELDEEATVNQQLTVQKEGNREISRTEQELRVLNNLVSAYFDLAEINAIEQREMTMSDYVRELDTILSSTGRKLLSGSGKISRKSANDKAKEEYRKYKAKTLENVEKDYLKTITMLEQQAKKESRNKGNKS